MALKGALISGRGAILLNPSSDHAKRESPPRRRLIPTLKELWRRHSERYFEHLFIFCVLFAVGLIGYFVKDKLAFLNFYFIPVLLAGYFLSARSAALGSVLAILWVAFSVVLAPDMFFLEQTRVGLYLHLVAWGSFLMLCGVLVGRLNEQVLEKLARLKTLLEDWRRSQADLQASHRGLDDKNAALDSLRVKLESLLYSSADAVAAHLATTSRFSDELRRISALTIEIDGLSVALGSLPPAIATGELNRLWDSVDPVITSYRGQAEGHGNDSLRAEFGIPVPLRRDALLAVLAALKAQERAALISPWKLRIGVAHGPAIVGLLGPERRRRYGAVGEAVDRASRLARMGLPGSILVDRAVHERIEGAFKTRPWPELDASEALFEVIGPKEALDDAARVPGRARAEALRRFEAIGLRRDFLLPLEGLEGNPGHSQAVAALSLAMAEALSLPEETALAVFLAGFYHEVGRRGLTHLAGRDEDDGALGEADEKLLRSHPLAARAVLADLGVSLPEKALRAIREHLEDFDGGSPILRLQGEAISLGARIVRLAHEYDSRVGWRPRRKAWTPPEALAAMKLDADMGGIDATLFEVFQDLLLAARA